ncbi:hypothetical protein HYC85_003165 [Camellia sinensis]|uniref:Uncharacterized protein n=1 Tax=Camellia sinensis TaxID=4442 RepID=A0A7J7IBP0_CAMSI|nr:hypothetical protein HYC85_003165 [Camellia sinensis]
MEKEAVGSSPLLPPPPIILPTVKPEKLDTLKRFIISRRGFGSAGRCISLLTNHFKVSIKSPDEIFYQYNVSTTMILTLGPAIDFLLANQNAREPHDIDWAKFCAFVSFQRYTKALSSIQRASLVEKSRKKPQERIRVVTDLRAAIKKSTAIFDKEKAQERLTKLSGGVVVFKVRRANKAEVEERKDWVTNALNATRAVWKRELF